MKGILHRLCVYCNTYKEPRSFNREHVIPEALGLFGSQTLTLTETVCENCNRSFSDKFELAATRDSILLSYRRQYGLITPKTLKHRRNYSDFVIPEGSEDISVSLKTINGVECAIRRDTLIIYNSTRGRRLVLKHFTEKDCHRTRLESLGLCPQKGYIEAHFDLFELTNTQNISKEEIIEAKCNFLNNFMLQCDINFSITPAQGRIILDTSSIKEVHLLSTFSPDFFRLSAKIALNYFLYFNRDHYSFENFKDIISYIKDGGNYLNFLGGDPKGSLISLPNEVRPTQFHTIFPVKTKKNKLFAVISLFNHGLFFIKLAENYFFPLNDQVHIFNVQEKIIIKSSLSSAFLNNVLNVLIQCRLYP